MNEGFIKNLIRKYVENDHSTNTQLLFRYWFRLNENKVEKDEAMQEMWDHSDSTITNETLNDLSKLQQLIESESHSQKPRYSLYSKKIAKYAAVVALIISSSTLTYYLSREESVKFAEVRVPYGEFKKVTLPDSSEVWINAGSTLIYPTRFSAQNRTVYLSGEANFSVTKNPHKPFIVNTNHINVQVLGTKFDVQAYPDMSYTTTTLVEGCVRVNLASDTTQNYTLKPDEKFAFSNKSHEVSISKVDAAKLTSWNKGYLIFQGASFDEIVLTLERKYNIHINYDVEKYKGVSYYGKFNSDESIEQVMTVLCKLVKNASYQIHGTNVLIQSK